MKLNRDELTAISALWGSRSISPSTTPISRTYNRNKTKKVNKHYKEVR